MSFPKGSRVFPPCNKALWTRENLAWLAGLFEGEACFSVRQNRGCLQLHIALNMTDEDVVRRAHEIVGAGKVRGPIRDRSKPNHCKPFWRLNIYTVENVQEICGAIYEFMGARRKEKIGLLLAARRSP